jgi:hypothetical protein
MKMKRIATAIAAALVAAAAGSTGATAATPSAGKFQGVTSQKDHGASSQTVELQVRKRHGAARVTGGELQVTLDCEDGSSLARTVHLPGSKVSRAGRFTISDASGGSYGPDGHISLRLAVSGRFTGARKAEGTLEAKALVSDSTTSPAVACFSGTVAWVGERAG